MEQVTIGNGRKGRDTYMLILKYERKDFSIIEFIQKIRKTTTQKKI